MFNGYPRQVAQSERFESKFKSDLDSGSIHGCHITRAHDATPALVNLGNMQQDLFPHARYLLPPDDTCRRWRAVRLDDYKRCRLIVILVSYLLVPTKYVESESRYLLSIYLSWVSNV